MSTKFKTSDRYPVSSDVVIKMFSDPEFYAAKMTELGFEHEILDSATNGDKFTISTKRFVPIEASGIVKKILGSTTEVTNEETWDSSDKSGVVTVLTKGVPLDMNCTARMSDDGDEAVVEYEWEIKARIPLGGGALEKFVMGDMQKGQKNELAASLTLVDKYK